MRTVGGGGGGEETIWVLNTLGRFSPSKACTLYIRPDRPIQFKKERGENSYAARFLLLLLLLYRDDKYIDRYRKGEEKLSLRVRNTFPITRRPANCLVSERSLKRYRRRSIIQYSKYDVVTRE